VSEVAVAPNFPKDAMVRKVNLEPAIMFGAGRALMLQLAHEAVAQGVDDHSDFQGNPFKRLLGTLEAVNAMVLGSEELASGVGRRVQWIHDFIVGPTYRANDPANLLWVHATLADTALRCYEEYVEPLTDDEREAYYQEMTRIAEAFGCPRDAQPATYPEFRAYVDDVLATIDVTPVGRELATFILRPVLPLGLHVPLAPLLRQQRGRTLGSLPERIRQQLGEPWSDRDQARHDRAVRRTRQIIRLVPRSVRTAGVRLQGQGLLLLARRHVRQFEQREDRGRPRFAA
jgi:uncharacterized protein (DUF2236 family)